MMIKEIYKIIDRSTGKDVGAYSRSYSTQYEFGSLQEARGSNCHGIYEDEDKYAIQKYRVTYELVDGDVKEEY